MKKFGMMMAMAGIMAVAAPVFAEGTHSQRDECLVASHGCATRAKTINEQIAILQAEIGKGTAVYSKAEIDKLSAKLKDVEDTLHILLKR